MLLLAIDRQTGLLVYGGNLDWDVALHDFVGFHDLQVPRRLTAQTQGGPRLTAQVTLLEDLSSVDARMIRVTKATPARQQLRVVVVPEPQLRELAVNTPTPRWPELGAGAPSGVMTMRVVVDRSGKVQSIDNFFPNEPILQAAAEQQLLSWRFRPYLQNNAPVQVVSTLTFAYTTDQTSH